MDQEYCLGKPQRGQGEDQIFIVDVYELLMFRKVGSEPHPEIPTYTR